jgi:hypothetical protein
MSLAMISLRHPTMLSTLERLGVTGTALNWLFSYLSSRSQSVRVEDVKSTPADLTCGVPQGSVLGPILFTIYTSSLGDLLRRHQVSYHLYADDTQLWIECDPRDPSQAVSQMETCISSVKTWMAAHSLKMNETKTEFVLVASKRVHKNIPNVELRIGDHLVRPSPCAKNLGVTFNSNATMETHISSVCRSSYLHLRRLRRIKPYLPTESLESLVHAFVTSRLDYCNSLYLGAPCSQIQRLQRIQNCAARLLTGTGRCDHITPVLKSLHWLPVQQRILFKTLLLVFKTQNNIAPKYLCDMIQSYVPSRRLRSGDQLLLSIPFTKSSLVKNVLSVLLDLHFLMSYHCPSRNPRVFLASRNF